MTKSVDRNLLVLMSPSLTQFDRMYRSLDSSPKWFGSPVLNVSSNIEFSRNPLKVLMRALSLRRRTTFVVFTVGKIEAAIALLPFSSCRIVSLHQWSDRKSLSKLKRFIYERLLNKSDAICTYSMDDSEALKVEFGAEKIHWIGHFVDTDFFSNHRIGSVPNRDYILCPGDHKRLEQTVVDIATSVKRKIVRLTSDQRVLKFYETVKCPYIEIRSKVPFSVVRELYENASFVLNAVDDRHWPVGITTFCEALSMNCRIVTSDGHSCSGYLLPDGSRPYLTVSATAGVAEWIRVINACDSLDNYVNDGAPRRLALMYCSFDSVSRYWDNVLKLV